MYPMPQRYTPFACADCGAKLGVDEANHIETATGWNDFCCDCYDWLERFDGMAKDEDPQFVMARELAEVVA